MCILLLHYRKIEDTCKRKEKESQECSQKEKMNTSPIQELGTVEIFAWPV